MGNVVIFERAFKECGIGGRFSRFQLIQIEDWFELVNVNDLQESRYCFKVYDRIDHKRYKALTSTQAFNFKSNDSHWLRYFQTAQKIIAHIVSRGTTKEENRYYYDCVHESIFVVNRMYVIEITPTLRHAPEVESTGVFDYLDTLAQLDYADNDHISAYTHYGKVVVGVNEINYNTLMTVDEFNRYFGAL